MTLTISTAARNAQATAQGDLLDAGPGPGLVRVYTAPRPAGPGTAPGAAVLLGEFTLNDPAFGAPANGVRTLDITPELSTLGLAAGDAAWARALDSTGAAVFDGKVTATGGGGDFTMPSVAVTLGMTLKLSGTITAPAGVAD